MTTDPKRNPLRRHSAIAEILVEALPYIKKFQNKTLVIKYGGSLMVDEKLQEVFAKDIVLLKYIGVNPIIVHGGGKEISRWMNLAGREAKFIDGLRYTDTETMEITEMVLSGKINKQIVNLINQQGGSAVGLSGKDAELLLCKKIRSKSGEDLGLVGQVDEVNTDLLSTLTSAGHIPVISSVGVTPEGETLNINADTAAAALATALRALKLFYLTDVQGLIVDGELQQQLTCHQAKQLMEHPDIQGGMLPKLADSISALEDGVDFVHIINGSLPHAVLLEIFTDSGIGTMISA